MIIYNKQKQMMSGQITFEIRHQFTSSQCFFEKIILITPGILSPSDLDGIDLDLSFRDGP